MDRHRHQGHHHGGREEYPPPGGPPPPPSFSNYPGPPAPDVYHTSHSGPGPDFHHGPPQPSFPHHSGPPPYGPHTGHGGPPSVHPELANKPTVRMYCKGGTEFSLAIRDGKVIVARSDPYDPSQQWIKDEKFSTRVKDDEGFPSFALVNKATGQALKHATGATKPVQLIPYNPNALDESVLWTESKDTGDNYRAIRMVNNIRLNVDVFHGDKNHGGVHDGSTIVLWEWKKGDNQRWKIVPHCQSLMSGLLLSMGIARV